MGIFADAFRLKKGCPNVSKTYGFICHVLVFVIAQDSKVLTPQYGDFRSGIEGEGTYISNYKKKRERERAKGPGDVISKEVRT